MPDKPFVSVVVPMLNEEENVEALYARLKDVLSKEAGRYEIVFVDDGSEDRTVERVSALHQADPNVKLVSLSRNFGHQTALTAGLDHASGDVVVTMDADLQHPPDLIPQLLAKHREGYDVVSGVKSGRGKRSWFLELTASIYYFLISRLSSVEIDTHASDFRLMDRKVVLALRSLRESTRFLRGLVKWIGFKSTTVPYAPGERYRGHPTYTFSKRVGVGAAGVFTLSVVPLRLATFTGLFLGFLGAGATVYGFFRPLENWQVLTIVMLFVGALQLVFLGIVGEYLGRVFLEVKRRPLYLVRNRLGVSESAPPR